MATTKPEYMMFYVLGREADVLEDKDIDENDVADEIMAGADLRTTLIALGTTLAAPLSHSEKRGWVQDNDEDIKEAGGDADEAWRCYQAGRIDQYAHELEAPVVECMIGADDEEDENDDDDDDEEEDEDED